MLAKKCKRHFILMFLAGSTIFIAFYLYLCCIGSSQSSDPNKNKMEMSATKRIPTGLLKINSEGKYMPFYGYTTISLVEDWHPYSAIEDFIRNSPVLSKYMTPLPASSYHVTIFSILHTSFVPEKYEPASRAVPSVNWIHVLQNLQKDLMEIQKICSNITQKISFWKTDFNLKTEPGRALTIDGELSEMELISSVRERCLAVFPVSPRPAPKYHMTVAYLYKRIPESDMKDVKMEMDKIWALVPDEQLLQKPGVFYFEKMTEFLPFEGLKI